MASAQAPRTSAEASEATGLRGLVLRGRTRLEQRRRERAVNGSAGPRLLLALVASVLVLSSPGPAGRHLAGRGRRVPARPAQDG